jgi:hypothetical protein
LINVRATDNMIISVIVSGPQHGSLSVHGSAAAAL